MLRIERDATVDEGLTAFRLEGQITGPWVEELRTACLDAIGRGAASVRLDLRGVTFIDFEGLELLRDLRDRVVVTRSSLFAAAQLKALAHDWKELR